MAPPSGGERPTRSARWSAGKERARRLTEEATALRERLGRQLGGVADIARGEALSPLLEQFEQRAAELGADNHRQRRRISQLEFEVRELTETLDAARVMNRELMNELNRNAGESGTGARTLRRS